MALSLELNCINCVDSQDNEPVEIIDNLYMGSCFASYNKEALIQRNVKYIVNCSGEDNTYGHEFVYLHVRVKDKEFFNFLSSLYYSVDFIAEGLQKGSVFVYCSRGRCRSVSTIVGFLITFCKMSFDDALQLLFNKRPQMKINDAFLMQLRLYFECDCSIHVSSQLFMLYELTMFYNRFTAKGRQLKYLKQYQSLIPACAEICYPNQSAHFLPLPRYIAKQFHCSRCQHVLFRYHNLLDHRNINYCELSAALFALTENQNQVHSVHCNSEFIHDTLFRKSHFDQDFECVSPSHSCCSCVTSNITKLQLPVFNTQTSLVDFYPTGEEHFSPSRSEELSLLPNSISPIFCEGLDRAEITTIELASKSHSLVSTNLIDCLSDSSQESMSAPESSVCSPASKQRFVEDETLHLIELEDNVNESNPMQDYSHCKDDLSYLNQTYTRTRVKRSIFDEVDEDDENLDNMIFSRQTDSNKYHYEIHSLGNGTKHLQTGSRLQYQSPSPPLYLSDQFIVNEPMNNKQILLIPHDGVYYKEDPSECDKLFVEPLEWMIQQVIESHSLMGELRCPNPECNCVIGAYDLLSDPICTCGFSSFTNFYVFKDCVM